MPCGTRTIANPLAVIKMNKELKREVEDHISFCLKTGFYSIDEIRESSFELFDDEELNESWLDQIINSKYEKLVSNSTHWSKPTDFDRLEKVFDYLLSEKIICLHNGGFTKQECIWNCELVHKELLNFDIKMDGYCYYHLQDLERATDPDFRNLFLGFDSINEDDERAVEIGTRICDNLRKEEFEVKWDGTVDQRIEIVEVDWKKLLDEEDWSPNRVIARLTKGKNRKPFWKFW